MEQAQQEIPQKFMVEIIRLFNKLKEAELTQNDITLETTKDIIGGKLVFTDILKVNNTIIAQATRIDNRSLEQIKEAAIAEKAEIDNQAVEVKARVDEVIALVDPEIEKKIVEDIDVDKGVEPVKDELNTPE